MKKRMLHKTESTLVIPDTKYLNLFIIIILTDITKEYCDIVGDNVKQVELLYLFLTDRFQQFVLVYAFVYFQVSNESPQHHYKNNNIKVKIPITTTNEQTKSQQQQKTGVTEFLKSNTHCWCETILQHLTSNNSQTSCTMYCLRPSSAI